MNHTRLRGSKMNGGMRACTLNSHMLSPLEFQVPTVILVNRSIAGRGARFFRF